MGFLKNRRDAMREEDEGRYYFMWKEYRSQRHWSRSELELALAGSRTFLDEAVEEQSLKALREYDQG